MLLQYNKTTQGCFNTVNKAKIIIVCIIIFSILYNITNLFFSTNQGTRCVVYKTIIPHVQIYAWFSYTINLFLPFISLLVMNCIIIHKLRSRSNFINSISEDPHHGQGQSQKLKNSEKQIYVMLLSVTFAYLIFVTPDTTYRMLYMFVAGKIKSPKVYAGYYLFYHASHKLFSTNNAINFFLYVMSGHIFRDDLVKLFKCNSNSRNGRFLKVILYPLKKLET